MAGIDVSDGEIVEDLEEISSSEDDYFENLKKLTARKLELEIQNTIAVYGKENEYINHRKRPARLKRLKSGTRNESSRQDAKRNRSYRASSVYSNYSIHKRSKNRRSSKNHRHNKRTRPEDNNRKSIMLGPDSDDESSDEELLKLRLTALKSKLKSQEVRELNNEENHYQSESAVTNQSNEEDHLRILALKSAVLKKKEFFKERKQMKKMENERPYSPSDDLTPMIFDDDAMILSPLGSPFNEIENNEQEIDMDISNSPMTEEKETSDMDIAPSPGNVNIEADEGDDNDEETALRSLLLTSIHKKKDIDNTRGSTPENNLKSCKESASIAQNLKLALQRLKEKKKVTTPVVKSGTKTIAMILEENKNKKKVKLEQQVVVKTDPVELEIRPSEDLVAISETLEVEESDSTQETPENAEMAIPKDKFLFRTITNDSATPDAVTPEPIKTIERVSPLTEPDSSFSTITDTKNIPLLSTSDKTKRSRLITQHEFKARPIVVERLVIEVRADSETDDETIRNKKIPIKKTVRKIIRAPEVVHKPVTPTAQPEFEKNLESFLKNIRMQQEKKKEGTDKAINNFKSISRTIKIQAPKNLTVPTFTPATTLTKPLSSVKHLPLSSQVEYEQLLQKMKVLEDAKLKRLKARQLKRTKSISGPSEPIEKQSTVPNTATKTLSTPKKVIESKAEAVKKKSSDKITESLSKIPQLDKAAQQRLIEKTEINYKNHSTNLMNATRQSLKLLEDNEVDMVRQEKLIVQIVEIERMLKKYKASLNVVNQRVKVNVHKIVQSQREMIKLRTHQKNFGKICQQVGLTIRGNEYSLPEHQLAEVDENFTKIASKSYDIVKNDSSDPNVKSNMKLIADRVRSFVDVREPDIRTISDEAVTNESPCAKDIEPIASAIAQNNLQTIPVGGGVEEESEVSKMIKENDEHPAREDVVPEELNFPEVQKQTKGVLEVGRSGVRRCSGDTNNQNVQKKIKYESPLEFLRLPKNKTPSVNKILCPYQLEGTCNDDKCQMMHI